MNEDVLDEQIRVLERLSCAAGYHEWMPWKDESEDSPIVQTRRCRRCNILKVRHVEWIK